MPTYSVDVLATLAPEVPPPLAELAQSWGVEAVPAAPRPAASVVLCRDGSEGVETYLLHRHARMAFAASMVVFPGGGVHPADRGADDPWRACAVRETREETGVRLRPDELVAWAHWITPVMQPIRYDTRFYLAALPAGQDADDLSTETERAAWTRPSAALTAYENGIVAMMPPTVSILLELAAARTVADALALGHDRVVETVLPEVVQSAGGWMFRYPQRGLQ